LASARITETADELVADSAVFAIPTIRELTDEDVASFAPTDIALTLLTIDEEEHDLANPAMRTLETEDPAVAENVCE
jgi:hypothetical protein